MGDLESEHRIKVSLHETFDDAPIHIPPGFKNQNFKVELTRLSPDSIKKIQKEVRLLKLRHENFLDNLCFM